MAGVAAAAAAGSTAAPATRSKRVASGGLLAVLALEHQLQHEDEDAVLPMRQQPQRMTAASSPAGQRRSRMAMLAAAAAAAAAEPEAGGHGGAEEEQEEEEQQQEEEEEQQEGEEEQGEPAAAEAAAACPPMPVHLLATRSRVAAAQVKNRERIAAQRRPRGEPKNFTVGDAVLMMPQKCGRVGKAVGRNRLVCRVVAVTRPFGVTLYRLRSSAGVVEGQHLADRLCSAPLSSASELNFSGTDWKRLPVVSVKVAMAAQTSSGKPAVRCACRKGCGASCSCRKSNARCGRLCGCETGCGASCRNH